MRFQWDPRKEATNRSKHGISFDEARSVFFDDEAIVYDDPDHSIGEERLLILGMSRVPQLLVVVHCLRGKGDVIRIISARPATKREIRNYWEQRR